MGSLCASGHNWEAHEQMNTSFELQNHGTMCANANSVYVEAQMKLHLAAETGLGRMSAGY